MLAIQRIKSKLAKTKILLLNEAIQDFIPTTALFSKEKLLSMLNLHSMVYVKPNNGTYGNGVIRVEKNRTNSYQFQLDTHIRRYESFDDLYNGLLLHKREGDYVVQRGIQLLKHQGRRFDIRIMVQKNPKGEWETTGIIGRLAHPRKIVTNYHSGGKPMAFSRLMSQHLPFTEQAVYVKRLNKLSLSVARQLQTTYSHLKEIGIDIAIDTQLRPWILEVNSLPDPFIFRKLKNKSMFHKVYRYAVHYGRFHPKSRNYRKKRTSP